MTARRFPPPWTFEEANNACFIVKDANGVAVSYVYFEDEPGRRAGSQSHDQGRGPARCCRHCPPARAAAR
jgi:hypothetical protein